VATREATLYPLSYRRANRGDFASAKAIADAIAAALERPIDYRPVDDALGLPGGVSVSGWR
jgi:hypothetical protein